MEYTPSHANYHQLAIDLWFPELARVYGPAPNVDNLDVLAELILDISNLTYRLISLNVFHPMPQSLTNRVFMPPKAEVDGAALRALSLTELKSGLGSLGVSSDGLPEEARKVVGNPEPDELDEKLVRVAQIYVTESLSGRKPAKAVSDQTGAPISTAGHWIRRAKDLRYVRFFDGKDSEDLD